MFWFCEFPEYLQIFPEGTPRCDVVPPVFKARWLPWAPQQIIFLVSPAGKEAPSLLGFGCHISLMLTPSQIRRFRLSPTGKSTRHESRRMLNHRRSGRFFAFAEFIQRFLEML